MCVLSMSTNYSICQGTINSFKNKFLPHAIIIIKKKTKNLKEIV